MTPGDNTRRWLGIAGVIILLAVLLFATTGGDADAACEGTPDYCQTTAPETTTVAVGTARVPTTTTPPEFAVGTARVPTTTAPTRVLLDDQRNVCDPDTGTDRYLMPCTVKDVPVTSGDIAESPATTVAPRLPATGSSPTFALVALVLLSVGAIATLTARREETL